MIRIDDYELIKAAGYPAIGEELVRLRQVVNAAYEHIAGELEAGHGPTAFEVKESWSHSIQIADWLRAAAKEGKA